MTASPWKPCPLCGVELEFEIEGMEHPYSDTCPLDRLYILDDQRAAWNTREGQNYDRT